MINQKPEHRTRVQMMGISARKSNSSSSRLTPSLRCGYALLSFVLGISYLKVILGSNLASFSLLISASVIGLMCFTVCIFNLVSIWRN